MKRILIILMCLSFGLNLIAQEKLDVVLKATGEELKGKVTEVSDTEIKFIYAGETAVYILKKSEVQKITYASGRVETFTSTSTPTPQSPSSQTPTTNPSDKPTTPVANEADARNKVAILPFVFIRQSEEGGDAMAYKVQSDAYDFLSKHAGVYSYIDPRTTNALLIKAGVNKSNIMGYTMTELCNIVGAEFLVTGTVTQTKEATSSSSYSNNTVKTDPKSSNKGTVSGSTSSSSYDYYGTTVAVEIFNNKNVQVFSTTHRRALNSTTADYLDPLHYVLKRSPMYQK